MFRKVIKASAGTACISKRNLSYVFQSPFKDLSIRATVQYETGVALRSTPLSYEMFRWRGRWGCLSEERERTFA